MQKRHTDKQLYFRELETTTEKHLVPLVEKIIPLKPGMKVAEVGCSIGGNLSPFLKRGCTVYGIDKDPSRIAQAQQFLQAGAPERVHLFACDILTLGENEELKFNIIILRDVIEHMHDKQALVLKLKKHLLPGGLLYFAFPPWRMPFGGHQQVCRSVISKLPWLHLLPRFLFFGLMKMLGETRATMASLSDDRNTGISIRAFRRLIRKNNMHLLREITYFINPHYEVKFGLKPRRVPALLVIPWLADFYSTAYSCFVTANG